MTKGKLQEIATHNYMTLAGAEGTIRELVGMIREAREIIAKATSASCDCENCVKAGKWLNGVALEEMRK